MNMTSNNTTLKLNAKTWKKYTEDLFDFEAKEMTECEFKINQGEFTYYLHTESIDYILFKNVKLKEDDSDKLILSKDLATVKKKISDGVMGKIVAEINNTSGGNFIVSNPLISNKLKTVSRTHVDRLWYFLETEVPKNVSEGDILKIGRVRLKIDKQNMPNNSNVHILTTNNNVNTNSNNNSNNVSGVNNNNNLLNHNPLGNLNITHTNPFQNNNNNNEEQKKLSNQEGSEREEAKKQEEEPVLCKICFRGDSDVSDPLITPCKCKGSMAYIHYKCLRECIKVRITRKEADNIISLTWKNFECEICLNEYPKYIKYKSITYNVVDFSNNFDQYIVLDYSLYEDSKNKSFRKGAIVVKLVDNEIISIGRNQNNLIKLKDISVSRSHCQLMKKGNELFIMDKKSKFGTLLYLNKPFTLTNDSSKINFKAINKSSKNGNIFHKNFTDCQVNLVSGKNFLSFKLETSWSLFGSLFSNTFCCKCKKSDEDYVFNLDSNRDNDGNKEENNYLNDSYADNFMRLDTIIKYTENCAKDSIV